MKLIEVKPHHFVNPEFVIAVLPIHEVYIDWALTGNKLPDSFFVKILLSHSVHNNVFIKMDSLAEAEIKAVEIRNLLQ